MEQPTFNLSPMRKNLPYNKIKHRLLPRLRTLKWIRENAPKTEVPPANDVKATLARYEKEVFSVPLSSTTTDTDFAITVVFEHSNTENDVKTLTL
ncbi:hypothetical protein HK098_003605 [Nowakowskiella sp. JEL0407]|nr:hypothetical protein HK098_003605 [Nowakowskiella sp. JEL0407]